MSRRTADGDATCAAARATRRTAAPGPLGRVLVVDDDRRRASQTARWLCEAGWHSSAAGDVGSAVVMLGRERFDVCCVDAAIGAGRERLVGTIRRRWPAIGIVATVERSSSADDAIGALREGADDVVSLPAPDIELLAAIGRCRAHAARRFAEAGSTAMRGLPTLPSNVRSLVDRIGPTRATVLVTGESGTGKSLLAREIHAVSPRRDRGFVEVACGAVCDTLLESELFGHVAGAFTGATADRPGRFLQADGGTIFLDEIATASPGMQVKLLRVLQERRFEPVGSGATREVDARVILATHESLAERVAEGRFREDLFWRINVVTIELPPLRERVEEIPVLAAAFLATAAAESGRTVEGFTDAALDALRCHRWPGNVRELKHAVERAVLLGEGTTIDVTDLPASILGAGDATAPIGGIAATPLKQSLEVPERRLILDALERHGWCRHAAAKSLGINRTTLYKKFKRLGIDPAELRPRTRSSAVSAAAFRLDPVGLSGQSPG